MKTVKISPSILAADLSCLGDEISRAVAGGCDDIHVDVMDGHFVPNLTFGPVIVSTLRKLTDLPLNVHLMVDNPLEVIGMFADAGSDYLTVHVELDDVGKAIELIRTRGIHPGISLRPDTSPQAIFPYLASVDIVLVMSVYPGFGGQKFIEDSYGLISAIAAEAAQCDSPPLISVDGGITMDNVAGIVRAGANHIVAGTSIFEHHHAEENTRLMRDVITKSLRAGV